MKTKLLTLLISTALLSACNDSGLSGDPTLDPGLSDSLNAATKVNFDLLADDKQVVRPSFIAMDATDATIASDGTVGASDYSQNIASPSVAVGKTDGWGTSAPIFVEFTGNDLDKTTANQGFKLIESSDPTATRSANAASAPKELIAGKDFTATTSGKTLVVYLTKPLNPASNYMFAITDDLKDINGDSVGTTTSYAVLKDSATPPSTALVKAQSITHAVESQFAQIGVDSDNIIFSTWFTTASVGDVLYGAKLATAKVLEAQSLGGSASDVWQGTAVNPSLSVSDIDSVLSITSSGTSPSATAQGNLIFSLNVKLPYYLSNDPAAFASTPWKSGMPSLAVILNTLSSGSDTDKASLLQQLTALGISQQDLAVVATDKATQADVIAKLFGQKLTRADGSQLDAERLVTRYSPVPKLQSVEEVPVTLILPQATTCSPGTIRTTIFQHGITSSKDVLTNNNGALADGIIDGNCVAIFAIDHPIHGDRALAGGLITATVDDTDPNDAGNVGYYLNLAALPVARDNLRQSVIDVVNLRAAIGRVFYSIATGSNPGYPLGYLNPQQGVAFVGHSLGAITGVDVGNVANRSVDPQLDGLFFNVNTLALANPGAGIPYLLLNSGAFGNFVKGNLVAGSDATFKATCDNVFGGNVETCFGAVQQQLINDGSAKSLADLGKMYANFNQYAYAAQTILDTVDPINHAGFIEADVPVYLASVAGDQTIPNKLAPTPVAGSIMEPYSPFGGTLPLLPALGLQATIASQSGSVVKSALLFTEGDHSSLNGTPASPATTTEMRKEIASLIAGDGTDLDVSDNTVLSTSQ